MQNCSLFAGKHELRLGRIYVLGSCLGLQYGVSNSDQLFFPSAGIIVVKEEHLLLSFGARQGGHVMRCFWEQIGVLGPVYRLVGRGLNDSDIARKLGVTELSVEGCITWMLRFLKFTSRKELVLYAATGR